MEVVNFLVDPNVLLIAGKRIDLTTPVGGSVDAAAIAHGGSRRGFFPIPCKQGELIRVVRVADGFANQLGQNNTESRNAKGSVSGSSTDRHVALPKTSATARARLNRQLDLRVKSKFGAV